MRWLSFLFITFVSITLFATPSYSEENAKIIALLFEENEQGESSLQIQTRGKVKPTSFFLDGERPRVIFDFPKTTHALANKELLSRKGQIRAARIGLHQQPLKTRMVIDLSPGMKKPLYEIKQQENGLTIVFSKVEEAISPQDEIAHITMNQAKIVKKKSVDVPVKEVPLVPLKPQLVKTESVEKKYSKEIAFKAQVPPVTFSRPALAGKVLTAHEGYDRTKDEVDTLIFEKFVPPAVELEEEEETILSSTEEKIVVEQDFQHLVSKPIYLKEIEHSRMKSKEDVLAFFMTNFTTPLVTAVEDEGLMVLCEFAGVVIGEEVQRQKMVNGTYVREYRVTSNPISKNVRVVLQLRRGFAYDLEQTYYKNANVFALTVRGHKQ